MMIAALVMLAADPSRIPAPPVKPAAQILSPATVVARPTATSPSKPRKIVPTTTTTTVAPKPTPTVLEAATAMIGTSPTYAANGFWCYKFVDDVLAQAGSPYRSDGPQFFEVPRVADPQPGDLVFIDESPAVSHGQIMHVAIVESVTSDGVNVIQGNGDDASVHAVARGFWPTANVVGYGR